MIKKIIIRILLIVMVTAFTAVVVVQWLWIKYAIQERKYKFTSQVYDALNDVVYRIEDENNKRYLLEMAEMGQLESYDVSSSTSNGSRVVRWTSSIIDLYNNDISRLENDPMSRSSRSSSISHRVLEERRITGPELIFMGTRSVGHTKGDTVRPNEFDTTHGTIIIGVTKDQELQNTSVGKRLAGIDLKKMLSVYFQRRNINLPFRCGTMTKEELLRSETKNLYYVDLFPADAVKKDYYLTVKFDSVQSAILENMGWMFLASGFCVFGLLFVFVITIFIIMRQQKLSLIKNDFINNMTHEFKTPIATISLATSAITKEQVLQDKAQVLKFNAIIKSENDRMNKYVERILQQAKLDRGELQLNKTSTDIHTLVHEAVGHFMLQVQSAGGVLICRLDAKDFVLTVDEVHIMNVFCNLIDNAIKYSAKAPEIEIYTKNIAGGYVIGVQDHGIGISKEAAKKVFKRFYRVPSGNVHNVKGFGLGLSYVKSIVELHDATVQLTSKKGKGTLVEIEFKNK